MLLDNCVVKTLIPDSSAKIVKKVYYNDKQKSTYIIIDFTNVKTKSDEPFCKDYLDIDDQYTIFLNTLDCLQIYMDPSEKYGIPIIYSRDDKQRMFLMEDLGNTNLADYMQNDNSCGMLERVVSFVCDLYSLHQSQKVESSHIYKRVLEEQAFRLELEEGLDVGLDLDGYNYDYLLERISVQPWTICHRDLQSYNIMVKNEKPYIIDIQDMCLGPLCYDIGTLLYDAKITVSDKNRDKLIKQFYNHYNHFCKTNKITYDTFKDWVTDCGKIRSLKTASRHLKLYKKNGHHTNLKRYELAFNQFKKLVKDDCVTS
jgi:aminoglycoside/choline kinase family phosphotransferase